MEVLPGRRLLTREIHSKNLTMKRKLFISLFLMAMMLVSTATFGQRGRGMRDARPEPRQQEFCLGLKDLTSEQEASISSLRTAQLEKRLQYRNQMNELRARKRTLQTQASPDMNALNKVIDQMASLRSEMMKDAAAHRQEIRSLLTDEQRVQFDSRAMGPRGGQGMRDARPGRGRR
jgi:Spy/CpxP family protein refolding chaperone